MDSISSNKKAMRGLRAGMRHEETPSTEECACILLLRLGGRRVEVMTGAEVPAETVHGVAFAPIGPDWKAPGSRQHAARGRYGTSSKHPGAMVVGAPRLHRATHRPRAGQTANGEKKSNSTWHWHFPTIFTFTNDGRSVSKPSPYRLTLVVYQLELPLSPSSASQLSRQWMLRQ